MLKLPDLHKACRKVIASGWDFAFPPACVMCGTCLPARKELTEVDSNRFCDDCHQVLTVHAADPGCNHCGAPLGPYVDREHGCQECRREKFSFKTVHRLGIYDGLVRDAVIRSKYLGNEPLLMALADLIWQHAGPAMRQAEIGLIVPIPQHWRQRLISQHHAPEILTECWSNRLQVPSGMGILAKNRWTRKQAQLNRAERRRNQEAVFRVTQPAKVAGKTVLLVDDVLTTGATADSAAKALRAAGAKRVEVAVIARVLGAK